MARGWPLALLPIVRRAPRLRDARQSSQDAATCVLCVRQPWRVRGAGAAGAGPVGPGRPLSLPPARAAAEAGAEGGRTYRL